MKKKTSHRARSIISAAAFMAAGLCVTAAQAATVTSVTFTEIADTTTTNNGEFSGFSTVSVNNNGLAAFSAFLDGGGSTVNSFDGLSLTEVFRSDPGNPTAVFNQTLNNNGQIAYQLEFTNTGNTAINLFNPSGGGTTEIANAATNIGGAFSFIGGPDLNDNGQILFGAGLDADPNERTLQLFDPTGGGSFTEIVNTSTTNGGVFDAFGDSPTINNAGQVAFNGQRDIGGSSVDLFDPAGGGTVLEIANSNTNVGGAFSFVSTPSLNDSGQIAFNAGLESGEETIQLFDPAGGGSFTELVNLSTTLPGGGGAFTRLFNPILNNAGDVAFEADIDDGPFNGGARSLNVIIDGMLNELIRSGDTLEGMVIANLFLGPEAFNDSGQLAFIAQFTDGSSGVFLADLAFASEVPLPAAAWLFLAGLFSLGAARRKRQTDLSR